MNNRHAQGVMAGVVPLFLLLLFPGPKERDKPKEQPKRMPPEILRAKTVHLDYASKLQDSAVYVKRGIEQWKFFQVVESDTKADLILSFDEWPPNTGLRLTVWDSGYKHVLWSVSALGGSTPLFAWRLVDIFHLQIRAELARRKAAAEAAQKP